MQLSFLDATEPRLIELSRHGDPLERLNKVIDWQMFMPTLKQIDTKARKSNAGRTLTDRVLLFKILILKKLYALSDDNVEYQIRGSSPNFAVNFLSFNEQTRVKKSSR